MSFFLLGRDRNSGELRLLTTDLLETRETALERLSALVVTPELHSLELDYFIADFAAATPVLLVIPAQPQVAPIEGDAGVWEAPITYPESDAVLDEIVAEAAMEALEIDEPVEGPDVPEVTAGPESDDGLEVSEQGDVTAAPETFEVPDTLEIPASPEPSEAAAQADVSLAAALKRAADTLESEGIQAPPSVGPATPEPWPWESQQEEISPSAPTESDRHEPEILGDQLTAEEVLPIEIDPLEESSVDGDPLFPPPLRDEDFLPPRPVIMGDYHEAPRNPLGVDSEVSDDFAIEADVSPVEATRELHHPVSVLDDLTIVTPDADSTDSSSSDSAESTLTCDDCVYVTTCPNKDESTPDNCGNFQWKSG